MAILKVEPLEHNTSGGYDPVTDGLLAYAFPTTIFPNVPQDGFWTPAIEASAASTTTTSSGTASFTVSSGTAYYVAIIDLAGKPHWARMAAGYPGDGLSHRMYYSPAAVAAVSPEAPTPFVGRLELAMGGASTRDPSNQSLAPYILPGGGGMEYVGWITTGLLIPQAGTQDLLGLDSGFRFPDFVGSETAWTLAFEAYISDVTMDNYLVVGNTLTSVLPTTGELILADFPDSGGLAHGSDILRSGGEIYVSDSSNIYIVKFGVTAIGGPLS